MSRNRESNRVRYDKPNPPDNGIEWHGALHDRLFQRAQECRHGLAGKAPAK
jgi:hypothetical protein